MFGTEGSQPLLSGGEAAGEHLRQAAGQAGGEHGLPEESVPQTGESLQFRAGDGRLCAVSTPAYSIASPW